MPAPSEVVAAPVMRPAGAVGWRDVALDGLNCYLRCIEAILRGRGFDATAVEDELGGAVTDAFDPDGRPHFRLRGGTARWHVARAGEDRWERLEASLRAREPALLWFDAYYWPGDPLRGRRHAHRHAVLAVRVDAGALHVLDIDAGEEAGFTAAVPLTAETRRACTRVVTVTPPARPRALRAATLRRMIGESVGPLGRFAAGAEELASWWAARPPDRWLASAVDLWALGDVQPQLYLLGRLCRRFGVEELAGEALGTARQAKKISLFLAGLRQHRARAPYDLCADDIVALGRRLRAAERAAAGAAASAGRTGPGRAAGRGAGRAAAGHGLWERLDASARWHFGRGLGRLQDYLAGAPAPGSRPSREREA